MRRWLRVATPRLQAEPRRAIEINERLSDQVEVLGRDVMLRAVDSLDYRLFNIGKNTLQRG
jgi:hypothetical protein